MNLAGKSWLRPDHAGHGVQIDSSNYLLPVDLRNNDLQAADDLRRDAIAINDINELDAGGW